MGFHQDERGIIISWLIKVTLFLAVVGVFVFDAGSIVVNIFTLDSAADDTAIALSLIVDPQQVGLDDSRVFEQAQLLVASDETLASDARVVRNGTHLDDQGVVHVKLVRVADTLVVEQFTALKKWARATAEGSASTN
jgi:hypothetical protein